MLSNPLRYLDPMGLFSVEVAIAGGGTLAGGGVLGGAAGAGSAAGAGGLGTGAAVTGGAAVAGGAVVAVGGAVVVVGGGYLIYLEASNAIAARELARPLTRERIDALPRPVPRPEVKRKNRELCDAMKDACLLTSLADCDPIGGGRYYLCWLDAPITQTGVFSPPWPDELYPGATCQYWRFPSVPE